MTDKTEAQPEALRLADRMEDFSLALPAYGFDDRPPKDAAAELRRLHAESQQLRDALTAERDAYISMPAWYEQRIKDLEAQLSQAQAVPTIVRIDKDFRWDCQQQCHIPSLEIEFTPVPSGSPNDAKGWEDRDALAAMLAASPTPPARKGLTHEQIHKLFVDIYGSEPEPIDEFAEVCRRVEAAHGIQGEGNE